MKKSDKNKAIKKAELALCKLQDIYYLDNPIPDSVARKLSDACDKVRELIYNIESK